MDNEIPDIIIRIHRNDDVEKIVELWNIQFSNAERFDVDTFVRDVVNHKNFDCKGLFVADLNGKILGFVAACVRKAPLIGTGLEEKNGFIPVILVHPKYRRRGIGSKLLCRALDYLKKKGRKEIYLLADDIPFPPRKLKKRDPAVNFFKKFGFKPYQQTWDMKISLEDFRLPDWYPLQEEKLRSEGIRLKNYESNDKERFLAFMEKYFYGPWYTWVKKFVPFSSVLAF